MVLLASLDSQSDIHHIVVSPDLYLDEEVEDSGLEVDEIRLTTPDRGDIIPDFIDGLYIILDYEFIPGEEYSIYVKHADFPALSATTIVPAEIDVENLEVETDDSEREKRDIFNLTFKDPEEVKNYYEFNGSYFSRIDGFLCAGTYYFDFVEDELVSDNDWISDLSFNGRSKTIKLSDNQYCSGSDFERESYVLRILSIPSEFVEYQRSLDLAYEAEDNPFVEPTTLYSNVEGGLGIFSVSSTTIIEGEF